MAIGIISFGLKGAIGRQMSLPVFFTGTPTSTQIQTAINNLAPLADAVTACKLLSVNVTQEFALPSGLKASPVAGSDARQGALPGFDAANTSYKHSIYVPGWLATLLSGEDINYTGAAQAFIDELVTGSAMAPVLACDKYANDLTAFLGGKKRLRK